jgi:hypothetical protein
MAALPQMDLQQAGSGPQMPDPMEPKPPEVDQREYTEVCLLVAVETCAKGVQAGIGASNPEYASKFAQAAAALAQAYSYVAGVEQATQNLQQKSAADEAKHGLDTAKLAVEASRPQPGAGTPPAQNK